MSEEASPQKLQVFNTALITAQNSFSYQEAQQNSTFWEQLVKNAIGTHLINSSLDKNLEIFHWREGNDEVDFVIRKGKRIITLIVNLMKKEDSIKSLKKFSDLFHHHQCLIIGEEGIPLDAFFHTPLEAWIES